MADPGWQRPKNSMSPVLRSRRSSAIAERRLAGAALADDADRLALAHRERDAVHRLDVVDGAAQHAALDREPHAHVAAGHRDRARRPAGPPARRPARRRAGAACTGAAATRRSGRAGACSTIRPPFITQTRSAILRTMPRSCVMSSSDMPDSACSSRSSARICAWIVTSSAVVGSSAISRSGSLASAMAIITRWRWPPDSSCGNDARRFSGSGRPTRASSSSERLRAASSDIALVQPQRLADLLLHAVQRVQRGHRLLEDHRDAVAADLAQRLFGRAEQILAVEADAAARVPRGRVRQQLEHRERRHRLARAALADQRERLAALDRERDAAHRLDHAPADVERDGEIVDLEQRAHAALRALRRSLRAAARPRRSCADRRHRERPRR